MHTWITINFHSYRFQLSILAVFLALWTIFVVSNPSAFLDFYTYSALMTVIPFLTFVSLGLALVIISKEIDLSFPSIMGVSAWIFATVWSSTGNSVVALLSSLGMSLIAGFLNGILVVKVGIPSLIATLGTMFFWRGVILVATEGWGTSLVALKGSPLYNVFVGKFGGFPVQLLWSILFVLFYWLILNRHKFGTHLYHAGDNPQSARLMGVDVGKVKILVFTQMGFMAFLAGIMSAFTIVMFYPTCGEGYLLKTVSAVFMGGTSIFGGVGSIFGVFIGTLVIGFLETGILGAGIAGFWTQVVYGLIIILSLIFQKYLAR